MKRSHQLPDARHRGSRRLLALLAVTGGCLLATPVRAEQPPPTDPMEACSSYKPPSYCGSGNPLGTLSGAERTPSSGIWVAGTAVDTDTPGPVEVTFTVDGVPAGSLWTADEWFAGALNPVPGTEVCARAINANRGTDGELGCLAIAVYPIGHLEEVTAGPGGIRVRGWAIDPDTTQPITVQFRVNGKVIHSVTANRERHDVQASYPHLGSGHGFDEILPVKEGSVCAEAFNVGAGETIRELGCGRDHHPVSLLSLNLEGNDTSYGANGDTYIPWRERHRRLVDWMVRSETLPDIINLQQVVSLYVNNLDPSPSGSPFDPYPYETLDNIISGIKDATGANYRIAAISAYGHQDQLNYQLTGMATIYNADRLNNTTAALDPEQAVVPWDDMGRTDVQLRESFPCEGFLLAPPWSYSNRCDLVDGDGRYWSASADPRTGRWTNGLMSTVFELDSDPGKHIIVHNVHMPTKHVDDTEEVFQRLIDSTWNTWLSETKLLPPIVGGDFNAGDTPANFVETGRPQTFTSEGTPSEHDVDVTLIGDASVFPSFYDDWTWSPAEILPELPTPPTRNVAGECGSTDVVWSDHCAVFIRYFPQH